MAVPSSPSSITMKGLHNEMTSNNYPSATNPPGAVTMKDLAESGNSGGSATSYAAINTNSPSRPDDDTPHAIGEWYGYDHDFNASVIQPPSNLTYTATSTTQICFCFTEANLTEGVCVFFGSFGALSGQTFQPDGQSVITVDGSGDSGWMAGPPTNDNHTQGIISLSANECLQIFYKSCAGNPFGTGAQTSAASACITGYTQPGIPSSLSTTSITTSGMTIGWTAPTGGVNSTNGYRYYHGTNTTATNNTDNDTGNTSVAISGLAQNTRYYWTVKAKGDGGDFGTAATQESPYTLPGVPTSLAASSVTSTGMTITWTAPTGGANEYRLYFGAKSGVTGNNNYVQSGTSKSFTGLSSSTTYYFAVQASNADGAYGDLTSTVSQATSAGTTIQLRTIASDRTLTTVSSGGTQSITRTVTSGNSLTDLPDMSDPNGHVQINISNGSGDTTATNGSFTSQPAVSHKLSTSSDPDSSTGGSSGYKALDVTLNGGTSSQLYYNMRVRNPTATQAYGGTTTFTNNSVSVTRTFTFNLTISSSDIRLKENIKLIGHSDSKIPIYEFNFKKDSKKIKWTGTMAQDLLEMGREDAVYINKHGEDKGYYGVDYEKIDVDLLSVNLISEKVI